jgi:hypothetical protein
MRLRRAGRRRHRADDNPAGCSYVRVCRADGAEAGYWTCTEWQEDPQLAMGAILGAARA